MPRTLKNTNHTKAELKLSITGIDIAAVIWAQSSLLCARMSWAPWSNNNTLFWNKGDALHIIGLMIITKVFTSAADVHCVLHTVCCIHTPLYKYRCLTVSFFFKDAEFPSNSSTSLGHANGWRNIDLQLLFRMFVPLKVHCDEWNCLCVSHANCREAETWTIQTYTDTKSRSYKCLIKDYMLADRFCCQTLTQTGMVRRCSSRIWHNTLQMFTPKSWLRIGFS